MAGEDKRSTAASLICAAPRMFGERRDAYELSGEEAQEEDAQA
jgi:protein required for attachment to host cells